MSGYSGKFPDDPKTHFLRVFVANLKIGAIYALYPESFCDKKLAIRKVFAFCDSGLLPLIVSEFRLLISLISLSICPGIFWSF